MATATRTFGTSRRESHDASAFYARRLATASFSDDTEVAEVPRRNLDRIYHHTSEDMAELPDNSVALMVTSPPYHAGKDYDSDVPYAESWRCSAECSPRSTGCSSRAGGRRSTWPTWAASRTCR